MEYESTLGEKIKSIRKNLNLTLDELGKKVGVTHAFLSRIENNKVKPNDELLQKIAEILDFNDSQDYLNEFRLLAGTYDNIEKDSPFFNELKASGRLEINNYRTREQTTSNIVDKPFYKLNYLFESDFKVFYDIKTSIFGEKHATIEVPHDILHQLYKDINSRIIEYIKENPELLVSISKPSVIDDYHEQRAKKRKDLYDHVKYVNLTDNIESFMHEIFNEEDLT